MVNESPEKLTDEQLVEKIRKDDQELYRELVLRYQDRLLRYASYLTGDDQAAADVVQEALIKAYVNLQGFNIKKKFSSWIYRIVHNQAVNYLKKRGNQVSLASWEDRLEDDGDSLEEKLDKKELKLQVRKAVKSLPVNYRSVISLNYLEDYSYEQISDILRIPMGTVATRINRGKKMLRKTIDI